MSDALGLLNRAIELGRRELGHLKQGELEGAERLAHDRIRLVRAALSAQDDAGLSLEAYLEKLVELKGLHGLIIEQARKMHAALREEIARSERERRRLNGYGGAIRPAGPTDRFISRQG
jgi:hypothetical protein